MLQFWTKPHWATGELNDWGTGTCGAAISIGMAPLPGDPQDWRHASLGIPVKIYGKTIEFSIPREVYHPFQVFTGSDIMTSDRWPFWKVFISAGGRTTLIPVQVTVWLWAVQQQETDWISSQYHFHSWARPLQPGVTWLQGPRRILGYKTKGEACRYFWCTVVPDSPENRCSRLLASAPHSFWATVDKPCSPGTFFSSCVSEWLKT